MEKTARELRISFWFFIVALVGAIVVTGIFFYPVFLGREPWQEAMHQGFPWIFISVTALGGATGWLIASLYSYCRIRPRRKKWAVWMGTLMGVLVVPLAMGVLALLVGGLLYGGALLVTGENYNCQQNNCSYASTRCGETCDFRITLSEQVQENWEQGIAHGVFWVILISCFVFSGRRLTGSTWIERRLAWQSAGFLLGVVAWLHLASGIPIDQRLTALEGLTLWGIILVVAVKVLVQELFTSGYQYPPDPDLEDPGE